MKVDIKQSKMVNISDIVPYDSNPRLHSEEQINQVARSIEEFGWTIPILIDENNEIIAGHGRLLAGQRLGLEQIPCIYAIGWSDEQKKAYVIADNKLTENSSWDNDLLKLNLESLQDSKFDLTLTGFGFDELKSLVTDLDSAGLTSDDDIPDVTEDPISQQGDVWILGEHRVICGDSLREDNISVLMNGSKADLVLTDPPYNVDYGKMKGNEKNNARFKERQIENDSMSDEDFHKFLVDFVNNSKKFVKSGSPYYISYGDRSALRFLKAFKDAGLYRSCNIIWKKQSLVLGRSDYHYIHEAMFYGWIEQEKHNYYGDRKQTSVWEVARPTSSDLHPTMKPIALLEIALMNSTKAEDIVFDGFLGSGSTLIACEKNKRICYGSELDPRFCDVIIKRWQDYTGRDATLSHTGETYNSKNGVK